MMRWGIAEPERTVLASYEAEMPGPQGAMATSAIRPAPKALVAGDQQPRMLRRSVIFVDRGRRIVKSDLSRQERLHPHWVRGGDAAM
jgi:hypothetical protein